MTGEPPLRSPRVGLVGARRARQGLGPFVARDLARAGAEVPCFLVTRSASLEPAQEALARHAGLHPRGYVALDAMLERESLDALAILSPPETHADLLEAAAARGLDVLCEKPLVWGGPDPAGRAAALVATFRERDLELFENCQWPYALPAFERLHPGALDAPSRRFRMELQPASRGVQALGDALSHPLSVLQALVPGDDPTLAEVGVSTPDGGETLSARFHYRSGGRTCECAVELSRAEAQPRRAVLAIDGRVARRVVEPETYRLSLVAPDERHVPLDDPLTRLVADFVEALRARRVGLEDVRRARLARAREITQRMELLAGLVLAYTHEHEEGP